MKYLGLGLILAGVWWFATCLLVGSLDYLFNGIVYQVMSTIGLVSVCLAHSIFLLMLIIGGMILDVSSK